jgi:hypothetical protein
VRARLDAIGYPIGWVSGVPARFAAPQLCKISPTNAANGELDIRCDRGNVLIFLQMSVGWLITAFAITLGAPF